MASVDGQYEEVKRHLSSGCAVDVKDQVVNLKSGCDIYVIESTAYGVKFTSY